MSAHGTKDLMIRTLAVALCLLLSSLAVPALAQNDGGPPALFDALSRLQRNPAYAGRIVGTHIVRPPGGGHAFLYEVRILSPGDRIVIVYLDPDSGAVVTNPNQWFGNR